MRRRYLIVAALPADVEGSMNRMCLRMSPTWSFQDPNYHWRKKMKKSDLGSHHLGWDIMVDHG
jgi:hypothetical protein